MHAFIVKLENRPGSLADLAEALGQQGINITGVTGIGWDGTGAVTLISSDEAGTRALLDQRATRLPRGGARLGGDRGSAGNARRGRATAGGQGDQHRGDGADRHVRLTHHGGLRGG